MRSFSDLMGVPPTGFDPEHCYVTSWLLPPTALAAARLLISIYCFATIFTGWGWDGSHGDAKAIGMEFSYFTDLTYWGITFYFLISSIHGFVYAKYGQSWLDRWPRALQILHSLYYTTIVTFPFLVTSVYWSVLYEAPWFHVAFDAWSNISKHGLNSLFAVFEVLITATNPPPWLHLPFLILILALYLALAYVTAYSQGWYTYNFLNPNGGEASLRVFVWICIIVAAIMVLFLIIWIMIWLRRKFTSGKAKRSAEDPTLNHPYAHSQSGDIELLPK